MKKFLPILFVLFFTVVLSACQPKVENSVDVQPMDGQNEEPVYESSGTGAFDSVVQDAEIAQYVNYSEQALADAHQNGRVVLFFHAKWCPTCKAADADITKRISDLPSDLTILKTDYDTEDALKKKYGITYQHTFVQVDEDGNEIAKWNGGEVDEIIANVK